jgi:hypothetical protein
MSERNVGRLNVSGEDVRKARRNEVANRVDTEDDQDNHWDNIKTLARLIKERATVVVDMGSLLTKFGVSKDYIFHVRTLSVNERGFVTAAGAHPGHILTLSERKSKNAVSLIEPFAEARDESEPPVKVKVPVPVRFDAVCRLISGGLIEMDPECRRDPGTLYDSCCILAHGTHVLGVTAFQRMWLTPGRTQQAATFVLTDRRVHTTGKLATIKEEAVFSREQFSFSERRTAVSLIDTAKERELAERVLIRSAIQTTDKGILGHSTLQLTVPKDAGDRMYERTRGNSFLPLGPVISATGSKHNEEMKFHVAGAEVIGYVDCKFPIPHTSSDMCTARLVFVKPHYPFFNSSSADAEDIRFDQPLLVPSATINNHDGVHLMVSPEKAADLSIPGVTTDSTPNRETPGPNDHKQTGVAGIASRVYRTLFGVRLPDYFIKCIASKVNRMLCEGVGAFTLIVPPPPPRIVSDNVLDSEPLRGDEKSHLETAFTLARSFIECAAEASVPEETPQAEVLVLCQKQDQAASTGAQTRPAYVKTVQKAFSLGIFDHRANTPAAPRILLSLLSSRPKCIFNDMFGYRIHNAYTGNIAMFSHLGRRVDEKVFYIAIFELREILNCLPTRINTSGSYYGPCLTIEPAEQFMVSPISFVLPFTQYQRNKMFQTFEQAISGARRFMFSHTVTNSDIAASVNAIRTLLSFFPDVEALYQSGKNMIARSLSMNYFRSIKTSGNAPARAINDMACTRVIDSFNMAFMAPFLWLFLSPEETDLFYANLCFYDESESGALSPRKIDRARDAEPNFRNGVTSLSIAMGLASRDEAFSVTLAAFSAWCKFMSMTSGIWRFVPYTSTMHGDTAYQKLGREVGYIPHKETLGTPMSMERYQLLHPKMRLRRQISLDTLHTRFMAVSRFSSKTYNAALLTGISADMPPFDPPDVVRRAMELSYFSACFDLSESAELTQRTSADKESVPYIYATASTEALVERATILCRCVISYSLEEANRHSANALEPAPPATGRAANPERKPTGTDSPHKQLHAKATTDMQKRVVDIHEFMKKTPSFSHEVDRSVMRFADHRIAQGVLEHAARMKQASEFCAAINSVGNSSFQLSAVLVYPYRAFIKKIAGVLQYGDIIDKKDEEAKILSQHIHSFLVTGTRWELLFSSEDPCDMDVTWNTLLAIHTLCEDENATVMDVCVSGPSHKLDLVLYECKEMTKNVLAVSLSNVLFTVATTETAISGTIKDLLYTVSPNLYTQLPDNTMPRVSPYNLQFALDIPSPLFRPMQCRAAADLCMSRVLLDNNEPELARKLFYRFLSETPLNVERHMWTDDTSRTTLHAILVDMYLYQTTNPLCFPACLKRYGQLSELTLVVQEIMRKQNIGEAISDTDFSQKNLHKITAAMAFARIRTVLQKEHEYPHAEHARPFAALLNTLWWSVYSSSSVESLSYKEDRGIAALDAMIKECFAHTPFSADAAGELATVYACYYAQHPVTQWLGHHTFVGVRVEQNSDNEEISYVSTGTFVGGSGLSSTRKYAHDVAKRLYHPAVLLRRFVMMEWVDSVSLVQPCLKHVLCRAPIVVDTGTIFSVATNTQEYDLAVKCNFDRRALKAHLNSTRQRTHTLLSLAPFMINHTNKDISLICFNDFFSTHSAVRALIGISAADVFGADTLQDMFISRQHETRHRTAAQEPQLTRIGDIPRESLDRELIAAGRPLSNAEYAAVQTEGMAIDSAARLSAFMRSYVCNLLFKCLAMINNTDPETPEMASSFACTARALIAEINQISLCLQHARVSDAEQAAYHEADVNPDSPLMSPPLQQAPFFWLPTRSVVSATAANKEALDRILYMTRNEHKSLHDIIDVIHFPSGVPDVVVHTDSSAHASSAIEFHPIRRDKHSRGTCNASARWIRSILSRRAILSLVPQIQRGDNAISLFQTSCFAYTKGSYVSALKNLFSNLYSTSPSTYEPDVPTPRHANVLASNRRAVSELSFLRYIDLSVLRETATHVYGDPRLEESLLDSLILFNASLIYKGLTQGGTRFQDFCEEISNMHHFSAVMRALDHFILQDNLLSFRPRLYQTTTEVNTKTSLTLTKELRMRPAVHTRLYANIDRGLQCDITERTSIDVVMTPRESKRAPSIFDVIPKPGTSGSVSGVFSMKSSLEALQEYWTVPYQPILGSTIKAMLSQMVKDQKPVILTEAQARTLATTQNLAFVGKESFETLMAFNENMQLHKSSEDAPTDAHVDRVLNTFMKIKKTEAADAYELIPPMLVIGGEGLVMAYLDHIMSPTYHNGVVNRCVVIDNKVFRIPPDIASLTRGAMLIVASDLRGGIGGNLKSVVKRCADFRIPMLTCINRKNIYDAIGYEADCVLVCNRPVLHTERLVEWACGKSEDLSYAVTGRLFESMPNTSMFDTALSAATNIRERLCNNKRDAFLKYIRTPFNKQVDVLVHDESRDGSKPGSTPLVYFCTRVLAEIEFFKNKQASALQPVPPLKVPDNLSYKTMFNGSLPATDVAAIEDKQKSVTNKVRAFISAAEDESLKTALYGSAKLWDFFCAVLEGDAALERLFETAGIEFSMLQKLVHRYAPLSDIVSGRRIYFSDGTSVTYKFNVEHNVESRSSALIQRTIRKNKKLTAATKNNVFSHLKSTTEVQARPDPGRGRGRGRGRDRGRGRGRGVGRQRGGGRQHLHARGRGRGRPAQPTSQQASPEEGSLAWRFRQRRANRQQGASGQAQARQTIWEIRKNQSRQRRGGASGALGVPHQL